MMRVWIAAGVIVGVLSASAAYEQTAPAPPPQGAQPAKSRYVFASDSGIILNFIKPDKTADFEETIARLKDALAKSAKPERRQQAVGWKIFKAAEPGVNGSVIYVSLMDPAVKGADYEVSAILAETFPDERQALYDKYAGAFGQPAQNILNLTLVSDLGK
jgi:hypothetical protein